MIEISDIRALNGRQAFDDLVRERYEGDAGRLMADIDAAVNTLLRTDLDKALNLVSAVQDARRRFPSRLQPRVHAMRARVAHWRGDYRDALKFYSKAYDGFADLRDHENRARTGRGLMDVYMYLGRHREAIETGKRSLAYFRRKGLMRDAAMVMTNIGNVYHRLDNNRMALRYYDNAREIFAPEGGIPLAIVDYNRANIYANLGRFARAQELYETAARLYSEAGMEIAETQAQYSLAYLHFLQDRFADALQLFERVHDAFVRLGDVKSAAVTRLDLAELQTHLNQYGAAIMLAEESADEFKRLGMRYEEAKANYFAAWSRLKLGDTGPAARQLRRAETLFSKEKNLLWLGMVWMARSRLLLRRRRRKPAREASGKALRYFTRSGDTRRQLDAETARVEAHLESGRYTEAIKQARKLLKRRPVSYQRYELHRLIGRACFAQGDYDRALKAFRAAVSQVEGMLSGMHPDEIQFFFVLDKYESYRFSVECLIELGRTDDALAYNLIGLQTANRRISSRLQTTHGVPEDLVAERDRLRAALNRYNRPERSSTRIRESGGFRGIEQRLFAQQQKIRAYADSTGSASGVTPVEPAELAQHLRSDEQLVCFTETSDSVGAFVVSADGTTYVDIATRPDDVAQLLRKLHFLLEKAVQDPHGAETVGRAVRYYLAQLYDILIAPIENTFARRQLIILPDGVMNQVPFALLSDAEDRYLCDRYTIRQIVNPVDIVARNDHPVDFSQTHNSVFAADVGSLPAVLDEGRAIVSEFSSARLYSGADAVTVNLEQELRSADGFLHIAAHASRSSENPLFSRILLTDGPFFPFDLFRHGVRARLVTLSGCQTAAPGLYYGNTFSLARAFYQAGSRLVVASQWPVSDKLSMIFMVELYRQLHENKAVPAAFDQAVAHMREITDDPAYWGGFVLLGL